MITVPISEQSGVAEARRRAASIAQSLGFPEHEVGKVSIVVTELATNLVKHARGGLIVLRPLADTSNLALEILSVDSGPGMSDVELCRQDGHSTTGTAGNGLGAVDRLSSHSEIYSVPGHGTVIRAVCPSGKSEFSAPEFDIGYLSRPKPEQEVCGDAVTYELDVQGCARFMVSDGLGHGMLAAEASRYAVDAFHATRDLDIVRAMERLHAALRPTRGAAVAIAEINPKKKAVTFCGIGNISAQLASPGRTSHMLSMNGIVGHQSRVFRSFDYEWTPESLLIMHSDGLSSRWTVDSFPGLRLRSPAVIAGVLYREAQRVTDDATVVVVAGR